MGTILEIMPFLSKDYVDSKYFTSHQILVTQYNTKQSIFLSELIKGKVTLFSLLGAAESQGEVKMLTSLEEKYSSSGFKVIGIIPLDLL